MPELQDLEAPQPRLPLPTPCNGYHPEHAELILRSHRELTGRELLPPGPEDARRLFTAEFFLATHHIGNDPIFTYGNQTALQLFELDWSHFTSTPSRLTAEAPLRDERERLLKRVSERGFIDNYSGIRISSTGRRFLIEQATVWNLIRPDGTQVGQAASFHSWRPMDPNPA